MYIKPSYADCPDISLTNHVSSIGAEKSAIYQCLGIKNGVVFLQKWILFIFRIMGSILITEFSVLCCYFRIIMCTKNWYISCSLKLA